MLHIGRLTPFLAEHVLLRGVMVLAAVAVLCQSRAVQVLGVVEHAHLAHLYLSQMVLSIYCLIGIAPHPHLVLRPFIHRLVLKDLRNVFQYATPRSDDLLSPMKSVALQSSLMLSRCLVDVLIPLDVIVNVLLLPALRAEIVPWLSLRGNKDHQRSHLVGES